MQRVVDAAVAKAYGGAAPHPLDGGVLGREGQRCATAPGSPMRRCTRCASSWSRSRVRSARRWAAGMRSLNVAMRQNLDLYACVRPIRYFPGVASPMQDASLTDMVVFRENTEDIYAGIEWPAGSAEVHQLIAYLQQRAARHRHPLSRQLRHRHQAGVQGGQPAADPQGHPVRHRARSRLGDAGAQGQHHEVHGRRLPQLGLPAGAGGVRRASRSGRARGCRSRTRSPAPTSWSRT